MDYYINHTALSAVFTVPAVVADTHLKLARGEHIKVLLCFLRNMSEELTYEEISEKTGVELYDVKEAMLYWADVGILLPKEGTAQKKSLKKNAVERSEKPDRRDVARRGAEDSKIRCLLQETQMRLGRSLKNNEASTLVWLYDDEGMDISIILLIVQYAVAHGKGNIRFIESTAVDWINRGIDTLAAADEEMRNMALCEEAWGLVSTCFGLERRKPSPKESELAFKWVMEWKISKEMLTAAYDACVDAKSKFSMAYTAKIIEAWHNKGYKTAEETKTQKPQNARESYAAYDMELFEQMLNTKD